MANAQPWTDAQERVLALGDQITAEQSEATVPATPDWTVRQLLAHLTGLTTDALADRMDENVSDEWTAGHVRDRADAGIADILAELRGNGDGIRELITGGRQSEVGGLAVDLTVHEQDLRGAINDPGARADAVRAGLDFFVGVLAAKITAATLPAVELRSEGWSAVAGKGDPEATVRADGYELYRALSGRRSEAQVRAFDWSGDPAPYVGIFGAFGPLRHSDLTE